MNAAEIRDRIKMIECVQETQTHQVAIPADWLEKIKQTLRSVLDDDDIPTFTDYVNKRHGGRL